MSGEILWEPPADIMTTSRLGSYLSWLEQTRGLRFAGYPELWQWSVDHLDSFWRSIWDHFEVMGDGDPGTVLADRTMPGARWFPDVRLNYAENLLRGPDDETVVFAVSQTRDRIEMTRGELRDAVARAAAGLRRLGVGRGDLVAGYLPNIPETLVALLATASIGALWALCAPELGLRSVLDRLRQTNPKVLVAVDGYCYGEKEIDRRSAIETIRAELPTLEATVCVPYLRSEVPDGWTAWDELCASAAEPSYERLPFDSPLWLLFSSGTTGLPKAIVHSHGGIVLEQLKSAALQSDLGPGSRYFVYASTSWVMWNLLVSSLASGSAVVLMDGDLFYPDPAELWRTIEATGATAFGCGASFLMGCRKQGQEPGRQFDLSCLRQVASTGSPLPPDGFRWVYSAVSPSVFLQSGSGGTDVCAGFVGGVRLLPVRAGEIACRLLGVDAAAFDPDGKPLVGELGELVIRQPMPSMPVGFWNDPADERYRASYFEHYPGIWRHGDWVMFLPDGGCVITGRSDGTLNRGGVRLGTSEFYAALEDLEEIADSLVVHLEDPEGGAGELLLFVECRPGFALDDALRLKIRHTLRDALSPRHIPDTVVAVPAVPYNLTGKKLEVPVKRILQGTPRADVVSDGAVRDPGALDAFEQLVTERAPVAPPGAPA